MNRKKAKLRYKNNSFDIIEEGDFVICAISGKEIPLQKLNSVTVFTTGNI